MTLWYDAKKNTPRKRTLIFQDEGIEWTYQEVNTEFTLNADIADDKFKAPEK